MSMTNSNLFKYHKLNPEGQRKAEAVALCFNTVLTALHQVLDDAVDSREFAIVRTKLEEACFFAKKAVAVQKDNQEASA